MDQEPGARLDNQVEANKIGTLIRENRSELGEFHLIPVGRIGYILQSKNQLPMAGNDWVLFDYDDTLVATTEVKEKRLAMYKDYLKKQDIPMTDEQASTIVSITDKFSRWEENEGQGKLYHANAHMIALQWATNVIKDGQDTIQKTINGVQERLARIKSQLTQHEQPQDGDPFYFRAKDNKLILSGVDRMWSRDIEDIFARTMINPPLYEETIEAAVETGRPRTSIHRINIGIFTYGDPYYQLLKVFELMKKHPDFAISQIWLTRGPKGDFITEAVKTGVTRRLEQEYVPPGLEEYPGEGLSAGSGHVLGKTAHVIVMMDDNPKELSSILSSNDFLRTQSGAQFAIVRSKRSGTKEQHREWQVGTPYGELDFTSRHFSPTDVVNTFLINRYLRTKAKLGEQHPSTKRLRSELISKGISDLQE